MSQAKQSGTIARFILPHLTISRSQAQEKLDAQVQRGRELAKYTITSQEDLKAAVAEADKWRDYVEGLLLTLFDNSLFAGEFVGKSQRFFVVGKQQVFKEHASFKSHMNRCINALESIVERLALIQEAPIIDHALPQGQVVKDPHAEALAKIELIAHRFDIVARQLRRRYKNRATLTIEDEYDVQDLLHALLRLFFDDVRPEEWTPSYAGGHSRIDFLLKSEQIVVELKMTRDGLHAKEVSNQLIIDIGRYRSHPDCKTLIAFVYDPHGYIDNPKGVERDLSRSREDMLVKVIITSR